jgi:hypothetical protein
MPSVRRRAARVSGLVTAVALPVLLSVAVGRAQVKPAPSAADTAAKKFKNIQILKSLPADQLIPVMRKFNASLGVECNFCHVISENHTGFEKDDKPTKKMARKMLVMVMDMNEREKVLEGRATCYMCHRGKPEPQLQPGPAEKESKPTAKPSEEKKEQEESGEKNA